MRQEHQRYNAEAMKILVSACLLGINCKYDGGNNLCETVRALMDDNVLIPVCPECLGKLPTPRVPSEIVGGMVTTAHGENVDRQFRDGAAQALEIARENNIDLAILQSRSPSCGLKQVYDGTFTGTLKTGRGVFAQMLTEKGYKTLDVEDLLNNAAGMLVSEEKRV